MPALSEASSLSPSLQPTLEAGLDWLSGAQEITFTKYVRLVLPLDGFVFWVRADLLSASALQNASLLNGVPFNQTQSIITAAATISVKGSLHYETSANQDQTETYASNRVVFTAQDEVEDFNEINPSVQYIGEFDGLRFSFASRSPFYRQAGLYHYVGSAILSYMASQIIDSPDGLAAKELVVSNSLPIWLSMYTYQQLEVEQFAPPSFPLYPSFLAAQNVKPPFATVHIEPATTLALASVPFLDDRLNHFQLCQDTVQVVLYGVRNDDALSFMDFVNQFSLNTDLIGMMNMPIMRDDKRAQNDFGVLAMRKSVEFVVSYYQTSPRDIARQLILEAIPSYYVGVNKVA